MAPPRPYWKGYLKLSLVSCPIALYAATSAGERVAFRQINKKTGNRLRQQLIDEGTGDPIEPDDKGRGYEVDKGVYLQVEDEELDAVAIESSHTIDIDSFVPKSEVDERYVDSPYYLVPENKVALEAFDKAVTYHEVWKPAAYDKDLHSRMGQSYASQAFLVMRMALRRETLLALMRLWDRNKQAVRMSLIAATIRKSAVIDALAAERAKQFDWPGVVEQMRAGLQANADKVIELTNKYSEGGSHNAIREDLLRLRDEWLAHRQIEPSAVAGADKFDEAIEEFYQDNASIIRELMHLANATAYDPLDVAKVYQHYAAEFWAGVRGERTEGHPHFRPRR